MDVGSEVAHRTAYLVQFESNHDVLWLNEKHYSAWWRCFQGSSELKSVRSGHQLPLGGLSAAYHQQFLYLCTSSCPNNIALVHSETYGYFPWREPFLTQRNNAATIKRRNWSSRHGRTTGNTRSVPPSWWYDWNWSAVLHTPSYRHCSWMVVYIFVQV